MIDEKQDAQRRARRTALDLLARREHSRLELERKLGARGYGTDVVVGVIEDLSTVGLFSEARFASAFVASRIGRGQGPYRIRAELMRRGLGSHAIECALEDAEVDWLKLAREVRERRFGAAAPPDAKTRARQMRFLEYRGFGSDEIHAAVPRFEAGIGPA